MKPLREIVVGFFHVWMGLLEVSCFCIGSVGVINGMAQERSGVQDRRWGGRY